MALTDLYKFEKGLLQRLATPYDVDVNVGVDTYKATAGITRSTVTLAPVITKSNLTITTDVNNADVTALLTPGEDADSLDLAYYIDQSVEVTVYRKNIVNNVSDFLFYKRTAILLALDVSRDTSTALGDTTRIEVIKQQAIHALDLINNARKRSFVPVDIGVVVWSEGEVHVTNTGFFNATDDGFRQLKDFINAMSASGDSEYSSPFAYAQRWFMMQNSPDRHNVMLFVAGSADTESFNADADPVINRGQEPQVDVFGFGVGIDTGLAEINNVVEPVSYITANNYQNMHRLMIRKLGGSWPIWKGNLVDSKATPKNLIMRFESIYAGIRQYGFQRIFQRLCPYVLYEAPCNASQVAVRESQRVTAVNGREVTVAALNFAGQSNVMGPTGATIPTEVQRQKYYSYGHIERNGTIRVINRVNLSSRTLTLNQGVSGMSVGDTILIYPACDRTLQTCKNVFNNTENFGGFPLIQKELSPSRVIHNYTSE